MSESDSLSDREHNLRTSAGLADAKQHMVPGGHEFFLLLQSVWIEQGRPLRWSLPSLGASSIQTANRPPAGRLTVAKQFIKVPLSRRGVKGSGVVAAEVRATMPRFDCSQEIRLIWTDAHGLKSKQPRKCICPPRSYRNTLAEHVWLRMESLLCVSFDETKLDHRVSSWPELLQRFCFYFAWQ